MAPISRPTRLIPLLLSAVPLGAVLFAAGCDEKPDDNTAKMDVGGKTYFLEIVADPDKRYLGLGKRDTDLQDDGGMLFVFPDSEVAVQQFVMRDCKFDIDIIFLDKAGRVLKTHAMKKEDPRGPNERESVPEEDAVYHNRLKKYSSKFPSQFVIEIKGGSLKSLKVKEGDLIKYDWDALKKRAR